MLYAVCCILCFASPALSAKWTTLVYMCADNGMSDQSYVDLAEMSEVGSTSDVNIVVQVDRSVYDSLPEPRRYYVEHDRLQLLGVMPELDMADPVTLADFVRYGKDHYPADNYMLVLWDHGNGWPESLGQASASPSPRSRGEGRGEGQSAICNLQSAICNHLGPVPDPQCRSLAIMQDWSSGHALGVAGGMLKQALTEVRKILGKRVAILALDACLMQMLEVACEVKDAAQIMISSEDLMPYNGFPYDAFFQALITQPSITPRDYAQLLPGLFVQSYSNGSQGSEPATLSAIDLARLDPAVKSLNQWLPTLELFNPLTLELFRDARRLVQTFSCEYVPPTRFDDNIDLIHLLELANNQEPGTNLQSSIFNLQSAVLAHANNDTTLANARGIAVWFPDHYLALEEKHREYARLVFAQNSSWLHFLNCFFGLDDIRPLSVNLSATAPGRHNDFTIYWPRPFDLAPVVADVYEITDCNSVFSDPAEKLDNWISQGFTAVNYQERNAFYSGISHFRDSTLELSEPLSVDDGALLSFSLWVNTREVEDTLGEFSRDVGYLEIAWNTSPENPKSKIQNPKSLNWLPVDSFYGAHPVWTDCRYLIPATHNLQSSIFNLQSSISRSPGVRAHSPSPRLRGEGRGEGQSSIFNLQSPITNPQSPSLRLRFRIKAGPGPHVNGFYVSDILVQSLSGLRTVSQGSPDTVKTIFNHLRGEYRYFVIPRDSFGNLGFASNLVSVTIGDYAEPYTVPAPVRARDAVLVCDYPQDDERGTRNEERPEAFVYTLSGELVNRFPVTARRMPFTAANQNGRDLASGIYLVVVKTTHSRTIGRIAIAR